MKTKHLIPLAAAVLALPAHSLFAVPEPPPAPKKEAWGFLKDLRTRTPFRSHWTRTAASGELDLAKGVRVVDRYGVAGELETARVDLDLFLKETKIAGDAVPLTLAKGAVDGRESYRIDVAKDGVTLTAGDDDGLRRAVYRFERRVLSSAAPALALGSETKKPWLRNRISRCFFGPIKRPPFNHDELMDDVDYYPEAYLNRLAHEGVNGLWLSASFRELARTSLTPTDPNADKRLEKLRATVAKCRRYGIRTWLFAIEPFSLPPDDPFLKAHPEIRGELAWNHQHMLCPSEPVLRQYMREATKDIFTRVPGLGGVIDICHGERPTTCMSEVLDTETGEGMKLSCPKCSKRPPWEIFWDTLAPMIGGMREANPEAEFICWFYQPLPQVERADWVYDCAQHMPEGVTFQYNLESGACKLQEGKWRIGGDYWLSFVGPAIPFKRVAYAARQAKTPLSAKLQVGCSHEVATVPYVPAPGLLYRKYREMKKYGVSSTMMCWFFGNYPGVMNEAAGELAFETFETDDEKGFLENLARAQWGELAPDVAALWESYTDGYMDYPLSNDMQYYGPVHAGIAWPLNPDITLKPLGRTWKPEDAPSGDCIAECLENHNLSEALALVRSMCAKADNGAAERLARLDAAADDRTRKLDVGVMRALRCQFLSARDALEFYWCRREAVSRSRDRGDFAGALQAVRRMQEIVRDEKAIDREMIPLCEYDARLGFHSEAENHQYHADKLRWRMDRLDEAAARLETIAAELVSGRLYPESAREKSAPVWRGVRRTAAGDLVLSGVAPLKKAGTVDIHCFDRCGTVTVRHYTDKAKDDGTFEVTLPATDWDGDRRLEPYWIRFRQGPYEGATSWPAGACAPHRLCLFDVEGCRFGRLAISE